MKDLALLEQMVSMESPTLDKALVDRLVDFLAEQFREIGGRPEIIPSPKLGNYLRIRFGPDSDKRILLLGHTDTVWPAGEIEKRPFTISGGRATGPGVFDMKAGILLAWMAMKTANPSPVTVLLTSDEEIGSPSSRELVEAEAARCEAVFVLEPSLPGGALKTSRKGNGRFTLKAIGQAAHAGVDPERGIHAIEEISHQILRLQQMTDAARGTNVSVGLVQGGTRSNVIPAEAAVEIDVRIASAEEGARVAQEIYGLKPVLPGARLEMHGAINRPPMERSTETVRLFQIAREIASQFGVDLKEGATGGASDGNFTAALGIPTLDGLGAIGGGAHAIDEWVDVASLPQRAALLSGLIQKIAEAPGH